MNPPRFLLAALLALSLGAGARAQSSPPELDARQLGAQIEALGNSARAELAVPALAIAVARGEDLQVLRGFGWSDAAGASPVGPHTPFRVGSLTRQYVTVAVLALAEAKLLELDQPITAYLPELRLGERRITVRQLLAGTSGIPGAKALLARHPGVAEREMAEQEFLGLLADGPFAFEPGAGFAQDSGGAWLLPILISRVSGRPCEDYVRETLLRPLDLRDTLACGKDGAMSVLLPSDCELVTESQDLELPLAGLPKGAVLSLCSTASDVLTWNRALRDGALIGEASLRAMRTPTRLADGTPTGHGLALRLGVLGEQAVESHTGGVGAFRVRTAHYPEARLTIVVLANCATAPVERIEQDLAARLLGSSPLALVDLQLEDRELKRLEGIYQLATTRIEIRASEGKLWYLRSGQAPERLLAQSARAFARDRDREARVTFVGEGDRAAAFELVRDGFTTRASRFE